MVSCFPRLLWSPFSVAETAHSAPALETSSMLAMPDIRASVSGSLLIFTVRPHAMISRETYNSPSARCARIASSRWGVIHGSARTEQLREDRLQCICPNLIRLHGGMEPVLRIHHSVEQSPIAAGEFVVDVQIADLPAIGEPEHIGVDPVDDRHERHIVVSRKDAHYDDRRRGSLR